MAEAGAAGGWHVREWLTAAGVLWSVVVVGLLGLVFRAGKVFQEHLEGLELVRSIKGDLKEMRAREELREQRMVEMGEKRDLEREKLRVELKADIAEVHRRVDEVLRRGREEI